MDEHGQPPRGFHHSRLIGRSADELVGIVKGVLADGVVMVEEADFLLRWMEANAIYLGEWPFNHLYARITAILEDGVIDDAEHRELLTLLSDFADPQACIEHGEPSPCELLCDRPPPQIVFTDHTFVITGKFAAGPRREIKTIIHERGGRVAENVSKKVSYLLLGSYGSRDWLYENCGRKLQAAEKLKREAHGLAVIAERHFVDQVQHDIQ